MSYSRHAVHDDHLATGGSNPLVNYKVSLFVCLLVYLFNCLFIECVYLLIYLLCNLYKFMSMSEGPHEREAPDERQQERPQEEQGSTRQQGRQRPAGAGQRGSHGETEKGGERERDPISSFAFLA